MKCDRGEARVNAGNLRAPRSCRNASEHR
ncbi:MAG: hypothetical protein JWP28_1655, partial [Phenylobacterium sp.]|nr:hypothetical protein [Phenylobacterium sp.]